jgi:hypothetical protein
MSIERTARLESLATAEARSSDTGDGAGIMGPPPAVAGSAHHPADPGVDASRLFLTGRRVVACLVVVSYFGPMLPFYGLSFAPVVSDSLWGDREGAAVIITLALVLVTFALLVSWFRTPNNRLNVSPTLTGLTTAAAGVAAFTALTSLFPPNGLTDAWGAIVSLLLLLALTLAAGVMWRGATLAERAIASPPVAPSGVSTLRCVQCHAPVTEGPWCDECGGAPSWVPVDPFIEPDLRRYVDTVIGSYREGSAAKYAQAFAPGAIVHPRSDPDESETVTELTERMRPILAAIKGAIIAPTTAARDAEKYWVWWTVTSPTGATMQSIAAVTLRNSLVTESWSYSSDWQATPP